VTLQEGHTAEQRGARSALLRVNADLIDQFVNEAGELSIARSRIEGEMTAFRRALSDLSENVARMRAQIREIEIASEGQMQSRIKEQEEHRASFDPLEFDRFTRMQELARFLAESLSDVITLQQGLQRNLDETELAILHQARLNRDLQQGLMGVRLVPLANLADRLYRVVRQTAKELDRKANLELKGVRVELDRSMLEKVTAPLEHLLRNAVAHGIERPEARAAAGKNEIGEIVIDAVQRGNEIVLTVSDDGLGLDIGRIRDRAVQLGMLDSGVALADEAIAQFIFSPGFSTATEITSIAGRGIGMDVVKTEITALGGRVEIASTPGRGAIFTISLPLTLAVTQAVMLRAGSALYAVPSVMIEQVQEFKAQAFAEAAARGEVVWKDNRYPLRSLLALLGGMETPVPARQIPVLLLKSGIQRAAVRVDEIVGNREVVVKTIGPQLARLAGVAGATVLGNGQVVLILNPVNLMHREVVVGEIAAPPPLAPAEKSRAPLVMVVDDSLTMRKITGRMLAREGYEFVTAKDGVDALQQLQDVQPALILLDVEMPRMDGFEFARNVRADEATRSIPIIMITSRTADKHRSRALELGVNEYMGKPYQEEQLLVLIARYARESSPA
jgi:chemosensory pili system protein ChpA (sensor histidine kinase/response regulator)